VLLAFLVTGPAAAQAEQEWTLSRLLGSYYVSDGGHTSWRLSIQADICCSTSTARFTSARYSGDRRRDAMQPREGVASVSSDVLGLVVPPGDEMYLLRPVMVGERLYLLELGGEEQFCRDFAEGLEPRKSDIGHALIRVGDWLKPVNVPSVPKFCAASR
jgi:hypothetical protein